MQFFSRREQVLRLCFGWSLGAMLAGPALAALGQAPTALPGSTTVPRSLQQAGPAASAGGTAAASGSASAFDAAASRVPYTLIESIDSSGATVHQYVNTSGIVFAVTWNGPARPDLALLLGASPYSDMVAAGGRRRGPVQVEQSDLVIRSGGRMGALRGSAWIPSLVPAGVHVEQLP